MLICERILLLTRLLQKHNGHKALPSHTLGNLSIKLMLQNFIEGLSRVALVFYISLCDRTKVPLVESARCASGQVIAA